VSNLNYRKEELLKQLANEKLSRSGSDKYGKKTLLAKSSTQVRDYEKIRPSRLIY